MITLIMVWAVVAFFLGVFLVAGSIASNKEKFPHGVDEAEGKFQAKLTFFVSVFWPVAIPLLIFLASIKYTGKKLAAWGEES
jgi:hypothetical protein